MKVIIYGSYYGNAKHYAEVLSKETHIETKAFKEIKNINDYDTIIYVGGLYAGSVMGLKKTFKNLDSKERNIIIITVGMVDVESKEDMDLVKNNIRKHITSDIAHIYHLKGAIDYTTMSFGHKTMMKVAYSRVKGIPDEKRDGMMKAIYNTYNQTISEIDDESLNPIIEVINQ